jgi:hypothetical protein
MLPAAVVSRIMTPAFAHGSVAVTLTTRAVILISPVICRCMKWNWSAVPQMSAPEPATVYELPPYQA